MSLHVLAVIYAGDVVFAVTGPLTAGKDCKDILGFSADRRHHRNWRRHHTRVAGTPFVIAVFMGVVTATGGGVIRGVLTQTRPLIVSGEIYATAALVGSLGYAALVQLALPEGIAQLIAFLAAFSLRAAAIVFNLRLEPRMTLAGSSEGEEPYHS